jgi:hypothetical protein
MIEEKKHIKELYDLKHRHDTDIAKYRFDYENSLFKKTMSELLFRNDITNQFLIYLQEMQILMFESVLVVRNFWNYTVDKYYNKHSN